MDSITHALTDLKRIIHAFKKELPDNIVKSSLKELMTVLLNARDTPDVIKLGIVGKDFENYVIIDGQKAVLPNGVRVLKLSGQYFLGDDNVKDEVRDDKAYTIGSEIEDIKKRGDIS